jgi:Delta7-sterol 5-desaturase
MLSWKSIKCALSINSLLFGISYIFGFLPLGLAEFSKSVLLLNWIEAATTSKEQTMGLICKEKYPNEFLVNVAITACVKSSLLWFAQSLLFTFSDSMITPFFIIKLFVFEVIFDGVHYVMHRSIHSVPLLYYWVHKKHHQHVHPNVYTSFYMSPIDLVLTYGMPLFVGLWVVPFSMFELSLVSTYLTYQEIGGHIGKKMAPTSSFALFVWLPRWLQIELYTEDHDYHHRHGNVNFSKRFSLWDKVGRTYSHATAHILE